MPPTKTATQAPDNTITPVSPPWLTNTGSMTIPAGAPGQISMLAQQLAAGGFGNNKANTNWLNQIYDPVVVPRYNVPPAAPRVVPQPPIVGDPRKRQPTPPVKSGGSQTPPGGSSRGTR